MDTANKAGMHPEDAALVNDDLRPTAKDARTWDWKAFASLWVAMVVCVPTYTLASSQIGLGFSWWQAVLIILLGNLIVLVPMILIGHAGTKYGLPFPVLLRSAFGHEGAKIPAVARGLVACGWFGINTWIGGSAIYQILNAATSKALVGAPLPLVGIDVAQLMCFLAFWGLHVWFIARGTGAIKWLEMAAAPLLLLMGIGLLAWAYVSAGGFGDMLSKPSDFVAGGSKEGQFWGTFFLSLTGAVGFWATMALNIPDFTRFARSQKDQMLGQAVGLPLPMALFTFIGVAVTSATVVIFGEAIWDPVVLAGKLGGVSVIVALFALVIATLSTNLAANVVAPAYGFSALAPSRISFKMGGYITAGIGIAIFPWKLLESAGAYIFTWLVGYSALLGPIAGILIADYFILRRTQLMVDDLFRHDGIYAANNGWNMAGLGALSGGVLLNLPGFLSAVGAVTDVPAFFTTLYSYAWFVGFISAAVLYLALVPVLGANRTRAAAAE